MWLTYMSSGLTLDALILNVRDLQAALPIILRAEQHCVDVPIFFFIFRYFPPLLLNHVDVRHEVGNKLVLVLLATKRAFLHPVAPAITSLLLSCQWTDLTGCDQNLIYWTRLHAKSCVQILFVSEFDVYWHWFLRFEHAWLVC